MASQMPAFELTLVAANVGSLFENTDELLEGWISSFVKGVTKPVPPSMVALHCQEVGGKGMGSSLPQADAFVSKLAASFGDYGFHRHLAFIDNDSQDSSRFTALGSVYFVHDAAVDKVRIWNFEREAFETFIEASDLQSRSLENTSLDFVATVHKHKFAPDITPMNRSSRKGFLRTRWQISEDLVPLELVNIHLFHDESNFVAMQQFPSMYSEGRRKALQLTLNRIGCNRNDDSELEGIRSRGPFFVFGDFNFRLDTGAVVSWLSEGAKLRETKDESGRLTRQEFHEMKRAEHLETQYVGPKNDEEGRKVLTLEKKLFDIHGDRSRSFLICDLTRQKLLSYDKELDFFKNDLHEFEIQFPPSYPYTEDSTNGSSFRGTRCPAWCDRVLFNKEAKELGFERIQYDLIGKDICMGDHKPVALRLRLRMRESKPAEVTDTNLGQLEKQRVLERRANE